MKRIPRLVSLLVLLGTTCQPAGGGAALLLSPLEASVSLGSIVTLEVFVSSPADAVQAFTLDVQSSPPILVPFEILPHAEFDDDGKLFRAPSLDLVQGLAQGAADLRHGAASPGSFRIATVRLYAMDTGTAIVHLGGSGLATPTGSLIAATPFESTITITEP